MGSIFVFLILGGACLCNNSCHCLWQCLWLAAVDGLGLSGVALRSRHYDPADWEGRTADGVSLTYATPFNLANHLELRPLDSEPLLSNGVSLVVRRDQADQPAIQALRAEVLRRFQLLQPRLPTLQRLA